VASGATHPEGATSGRLPARATNVILFLLSPATVRTFETVQPSISAEFSRTR
jgi:hypothetical protein